MNNPPRFDTSEELALKLDSTDALYQLRNQFYIPEGCVYMDGNSLGLASRQAEQALMQALDNWKREGIGGWLGADPSWFGLCEHLGAQLADLVGAEPEEVIVTGSTTVNLHQLLATFYHPTTTRSKVVADELNFPSDLYALRSHLRLRGYNPDIELVQVGSRDGRMIEESDVELAFDDTVALAVLPSVLYRSGQLLDIERLTHSAHQRGVLIGWDCSHSVGVIPHDFGRWNVDFAFWCNYKYLNDGPGTTAALYVNNKHSDRVPGLTGWWGNSKTTQFDMRSLYEPARGAAAYQLGTPPILSTSALLGALQLTREAGIDAIRRKSLALTDYMIYLVDHELASFGFSVGTPRQHSRRGGHVALEHPRLAVQVNRALKARHVIPDFRPPNVIRLAPIALYTSFHDVWKVVEIIKQIMLAKEYENFSSQRDIVG